MKRLFILIYYGLPFLCGAQSTGAIDTSFGAAGYTTINPTTLDDNFTELEIQADGKILGLGRSYLGDNAFDFSLCRLNPDGTLDTTYATNGINEISNIVKGYPTRLLLQPDGKAIATGSANAESAVAVRYNTDGTLDTTFGNAGRVYINLKPGELEMIRDIKLLPDGRIMMVGYVPVNNKGAIAFIRLNADGSLDTTFAGTGYKIKTITTNRSLNVVSLAVQPDGKYIAAGSISTPNVTYNSGDLFLTRINADGSNDNTFGTGSNVITDIYLDDTFADMALLSDGSIIALGTSMNGFGLETLPAGGVYLMKFTSNGTPAVSFGTNGLVLNDFIGTADSLTEFVSTMLEGPDGKFYIAGSYRTTYSYYTYKGYVVCVNANGTIDTAFAENGVAYFNYFIHSLADIKFDSENNFVAGGTYQYQDHKFRFSRLTAHTALATVPSPSYSIGLYPNPAGTSLTVNATGTYEVIDLAGRRVLQGYARAGEPFAVSELESGNYILTLVSEKGRYNIKFIKR